MSEAIEKSATGDVAADDRKDTATHAPAAAPVESRSSGAGTVFFSVFLSVVAAGAMVVGQPYWTPYTSEIIELPNPVKRLETETSRIGRAVVDLDGKVTAIGADTGELRDTATANAAATQRANAAVLALAGSALRQKLASGAPYELELAAVRAVVGEDKEMGAILTVLAGEASNGVATRAALRDGFPTAVGAVIAAEAERATHATAGWFESVSALVGQLGYVTRLSAAPEGGPHAIVREARSALAAGDLSGAARVLAGLPEPRVPEADAWIKAAETRVAADKADSALTTLSLAKLGASGK